MSESKTWNGSWRGWHLEKGEHPVLQHETALSGEYVIDLLELNTSAEVLDTIIQLHGRAGFDYWDVILVGLIRALNDVFDYQANLCSYGRSKRMSQRKIRALIDAAHEPPDDRVPGP